MAQIRIRKRGKTFNYIFKAGKIDGKRKVVEKGGFPTKAEAYKAGVVNVRRQIINLNKRDYFLTTKKLIKQTIKAIRRQLRLCLSQRKRAYSATIEYSNNTKSLYAQHFKSTGRNACRFQQKFADKFLIQTIMST